MTTKEIRQSILNTILNRRMESRFPDTAGDNALLMMMSQRIPHMLTPPGYEDQLRGRNPPSPSGSDMDMMMMYGPEEQVVYDERGRPIPLKDPRHPRNQPSGPAPMYPQQKRTPDTTTPGKRADIGTDGLVGAMGAPPAPSAGIQGLMQMVQNGQLPVEVLRDLLPAAAGR